MATRIQSVKFTRELAEGEKASPQMKGIIDSVVETHGLNKSVTVEEIVAAMEGNIVTKQPLARIFGYYAPKLEEAGIIEVERAEAAAPKKNKKGETEDVAGELSDEEEDEDEDELDDA